MTESAAQHALELAAAVKAGETERALRLLAAGAPADAGSHDESLLCQAIASRDLRLARALLAAGASPDEDDGVGSTALWLAVHGDQPDLVRELLARGADPNRLPETSALVPTAALQGDADLCALLVSHGADIDTGSWNAVMVAVADNNVPLLQRLIALGARHLDLRYPGGDTLLCRAAANADLEMVRALLALGHDPNRRGRRSLTPLQLALRLHHDSAVAEELVAAGAETITSGPPSS